MLHSRINTGFLRHSNLFELRIYQSIFCNFIFLQSILPHYFLLIFLFLLFHDSINIIITSRLNIVFLFRRRSMRAFLHSYSILSRNFCQPLSHPISHSSEHGRSCQCASAQYTGLSPFSPKCRC